MFKRHLSQCIREAMDDTPVVFLAGARQTGKSTLVKELVKDMPEITCFTMDDSAVHAAAHADPEGFIAGLPAKVVIDEVQRAPGLLPAIKASVDKDRRPGRFLLTGSANVFVMPRVSESLAGRVEFQTLWPLSQGEIKGRKERFVDMLFSSELPATSGEPLSGEAIHDLLTRGSYPEVFLRDSSRRRDAWYRSYITALMQRDLRDLAHIEALHQMPDILRMLASRSAGLLNLNDISRSLQIPHTSLKRYVAMLEAIYIVVKLDGWSGNYGKRLVKMPKVYLNDTGLICHLLGIDRQYLMKNASLAGQLFENFVVTELIKQTAWSETLPAMYHFRTHAGTEADVILESRRGECVCIEVKLASSVTAREFKSLRSIKEELKDRFLRGVVLYTGEHVVSFASDMHAIPVSMLWR